MLETAPIAGVSKTAYAPATPVCLHWTRGVEHPTATNASPDPGPEDAGRRRALRTGSKRRGSRPRGARVLDTDGVFGVDGHSTRPDRLRPAPPPPRRARLNH